MHVIHLWGRLLSLLTAGLHIASGLVGAAVVALIFAQVTLRFLGAQVPPAFEELGNFLFIWWVFLGAAMTLREVGHPRISAFLDFVPDTLRGPVEFAAEFVTLIYFFFLAKLGYQIAFFSSEPSLSLEVPMTYPLLALGIGGTLMFLFQLDTTARRFVLSWGTVVAVLAVLVLGSAGYLLAQWNIYALVIAAAILMFVIGVPVAVVLGAVTLAALGSTSVANLINYPIRLFDGLNNFVLLSIPLFMLTGALMTHGGISQRLVDFANGLVGWIRGGLGLADIVASVFFADVSGSAVSDTAAIGSIMIPAWFAVATTAVLPRLCSRPRDRSACCSHPASR